MTIDFSRQDLLGLLDAVRALWAGAPAAAERFQPDVTLSSSHRGAARGTDAVARLLRKDFGGCDALDLVFTNRVVRADAFQGVASAYAIGEVRRAAMRSCALAPPWCLA